MKRKCLLSIVLITLFISSAYSQRIPIAQFSGNGARNTRPFQVNEGWEIQWTSQANSIQIYVYTTDGELFNVAAYQTSPGSGSTFVPQAGEYYLQINARGTWAVEIVQVGLEPINREEYNNLGNGDSVLFRFSGIGTLNTRPFIVTSSWEIQTVSDGPYLNAYLYSANGELVSVLLSQRSPREDSSYFGREGIFYLVITTTGSWSISIIDLE